MKHKLLTLLLIGVALFWLIFSYAPSEMLIWRITADDRLLPFFRVALVASAVLFGAIQIILIVSVFHFPQRIRRRDIDKLAETSLHSDDDVRIMRRWELLWTAVPLVLSLGLFLVSYWTLRS